MFAEDDTLRFKHLNPHVMPVLVTGIHAFEPLYFYDVAKTWIPATSAGMTYLVYALVPQPSWQESLSILVLAIHAFEPQRFYDVAKTWIPVTSTGMTYLVYALVPQPSWQDLFLPSTPFFFVILRASPEESHFAGRLH
jgi:hypothetical protein